MAGLPDISILGPGKVGTAIGILAVRAGWPVVAVAGGGPGRAQAAAEAIGGGARACSLAEAAAAGRLVLLTVCDDAIAELCGSLATAGAFAPGAVVAHCCGALAGEVLASARARCRCAIGSMHPLQTFATVDSAVARMAGTFCFCEGDGSAVAVLERLAAAIGARAVRIDSGGKALYHAAAVMACNHLLALLDASAQLAAAGGVDRATWLAAVEPIVRATVDNAFRLGPAGALTGPVARGDVRTIARHAEALADCDRLVRELYAAAGQYTVALARRSGAVDPSAGEALATIFERLRQQEQGDGGEDH